MKAKKKQETAAPVAAKNLKRTRIEAAAHQLRAAPWNPRPEVTSASVADITASIREIGLIQPLVVIKDPVKESFKGVDFYLVVAGHRRFRACVDAGLSPIPCDVIDCDVGTAKRVTMIENLQRKDVDPLMEADLIAGLIKEGMTQAEIAAETGRGERWVARRANLVKLSPAWRKRVADGEQITIDCLEHVAAYPEAIQEKLKCVSQGYSYRVTSGGALAWYDVKWQFQRESRDLKEVLFDTAKCLSCPNNTGCCPDLFDDDGRGDAKLGKCLDAKCFAILTEEAVDESVAKAEKRGRVIVKNKQPYQCGVWSGSTKKATKTNTALYVYTDSSGNRVMEYAAPPPPKDPGADKEAKKAALEDAKRLKLITEAEEEACRKFEEWIEERKKDGVWPKWFIDCAIDDLCNAIVECGTDCADAIAAFARNTGFTASNAEADTVFKEYLAKSAEVNGEH